MILLSRFTHKYEWFRINILLLPRNLLNVILLRLYAPLKVDFTRVVIRGVYFMHPYCCISASLPFRYHCNIKLGARE